MITTSDPDHSIVTVSQPVPLCRSKSAWISVDRLRLECSCLRDSALMRTPFPGSSSFGWPYMSA